MPTLKTSYEFTLPRGYVDPYGTLHRAGKMRLATARDELEPLRDPQITGPDDPRLTILVLARVVEELGTLGWVSPDTIENLFAVDLAFLQDFYGVINFGTQAEYDALMAAQRGQALVGTSEPEAPPPAHAVPEEPPSQPEPAAAVAGPDGATSADDESGAATDGFADFGLRPARSTVEELPRAAF